MTRRHRPALSTAELLADEFHTYVPDLPGFGRSGKAGAALDIPDLAHAAVRFLDERGVAKTSVVGNSMGCPVIVELAHRYPERIEHAVLVSPAGGIQHQPLRRAIGQLAKDGAREPLKMITVATPDYLRFGVPSTFKMFNALTQYRSLQRLLELKVPALVVMGTKDSLMPGRERIKQVFAQDQNHVLLVVLERAALAINFSHPRELAHVIRRFMNDKPITDVPGSAGARVFEIFRGAHHPVAADG